MAEQKEVYPIDTFKVTLGGAETGGLFNTACISSSIDLTGFDHADVQGKPQVAKTPAKVPGATASTRAAWTRTWRCGSGTTTASRRASRATAARTSRWSSPTRRGTTVLT